MSEARTRETEILALPAATSDLGRAKRDLAQHGVLTYFARPFMRPQENCTLSVADDVLTNATPWLKELLDFRVWRSLDGVKGPYGVGTIDRATIERRSDDPDPSFDFVGKVVERPRAPIRVLGERKRT
jgi:hypothetical protein